jgi:hypothetical protein
LIKQFEKQEIAQARANGTIFSPELLRWINEIPCFKYYAFIYESDKAKFGLVYLLGLTAEKVSSKFPEVVDAIAHEKPPWAKYRYSYTFCEDRVFQPYTAEANAIKKAIRRGVSPHIAILLYGETRSL